MGFVCALMDKEKALAHFFKDVKIDKLDVTDI